MKVNVLFSRKKFDITCDEDSFDSLAQAVAKVINVPIRNQKLIFKGKSLQAGSLSEQGLTCGSKVMLIGSREEVVECGEFAVVDAEVVKGNESAVVNAVTNPAVDHQKVVKCDVFAVLDAVDKEVLAMEARLDELNMEFVSYTKGFAPEEARLRREGVKSLAQRLVAFNERGERGLVRLDGLVLGQEASRARDRRKNLADRIQALLNLSDSFLQDLVQLAAQAGLNVN